jgi:hypothetical protein
MSNLESWSVFAPNKGDVFQLNINAFSGDKGELSAGKHIKFDSYNGWSLSQGAHSCQAIIIEYHRDFYTIKDLIGLIWKLIIKNPKSEYVKAEWIKNDTG